MTTISIKYVNPAKEGKKFGSIKSVEGDTYWVPAGMVSGFQPGTTVDVPTKTEKWGANIVNIVAGHAGGTPQDLPGWAKPIVPRTPSPAPAPAPAPAAIPTPIGSKDALIFVTGIVGRAMGSGQFKSGDIQDLTHEALKAWFMLKDQIA